MIGWTIPRKMLRFSIDPAELSSGFGTPGIELFAYEEVLRLMNGGRIFSPRPKSIGSKSKSKHPAVTISRETGAARSQSGKW